MAPRQKLVTRGDEGPPDGRRGLAMHKPKGSGDKPVNEPEPGHFETSPTPHLPGRASQPAQGWTNTPPEPCASSFSDPVAPPWAAVLDRDPSGPSVAPCPSTCFADAGRAPAAPLGAGAPPRSAASPRWRGGGGRGAKAGPARGALGFAVQKVWPPTPSEVRQGDTDSAPAPPAKAEHSLGKAVSVTKGETEAR